MRMDIINLHEDIQQDEEELKQQQDEEDAKLDTAVIQPASELPKPEPQVQKRPP